MLVEPGFKCRGGFAGGIFPSGSQVVTSSVPAKVARNLNKAPENGWFLYASLERAKMCNLLPRISIFTTFQPEHYCYDMHTTFV